MPSTPDFTPKGYLKVNKVLFSALFMGVVIITVVFFAVTEKQYLSTDFESSLFMLMVPIISFAGLGMSRFMFKKFVDQAKQKDTLKQKLMGYRTALIIGLALCEAPALYANIAFMNEGNHFFIIFTIAALLLMLTYNPSDKKTIKDLDLRGDELDVFRNVDSKVTI